MGTNHQILVNVTRVQNKQRRLKLNMNSFLSELQRRRSVAYVQNILTECKVSTLNHLFFIIWFVRLLALRSLLAYCASLG
jgi:hypothetical protein